MADRYTGAPDVFNYNSGTYDPYYSVNQSHTHRQVAFGNPVPADPRYPVQPINPDPYQTGGYTTYNTQGSNDSGRYQNYKVKPYDYKYNIYSLIDEPWNRCCEVGTCGAFPGNECIARRSPKIDWQ